MCVGSPRKVPTPHETHALRQGNPASQTCSDTAVLEMALRECGPAKIIIRTASGRWKLWYRHAGEGPRDSFRVLSTASARAPHAESGGFSQVFADRALIWTAYRFSRPAPRKAALAWPAFAIFSFFVNHMVSPRAGTMRRSGKPAAYASGPNCAGSFIVRVSNICMKVDHMHTSA